jgi:hypothetical protein
MHKTNDILPAKNSYLWLILSPFVIAATTFLIASMNLGYWICVSDGIDCGRNGSKYLNYAIGLLASGLWHIVLLPKVFNRESAFVRMHGRRALAQAFIQIGVMLFGILFDWLTGANGVILNIAFVILFVIWVLNIKEYKKLEENTLSNNEKSPINLIIFAIAASLLVVMFVLGLDYEAQGNFVMAGMVFLIPVGALLILAAFIWGWMALVSLLIKVDKKIDDKSKPDGSSQPDTEIDVKG